MGTEIRKIAASWRHVSERLYAILNAIRSAQSQIKIAKITADINKERAWMNRLTSAVSVLTSLDNIFNSLNQSQLNSTASAQSFMDAGWANSAASRQGQAASLGNLAQASTNFSGFIASGASLAFSVFGKTSGGKGEEAIAEEQTNLAVVNLDNAMRANFSQIKDELLAMSNSVSAIQSASNDLDLATDKAEYLINKANGEDWVEGADGEPVPLHVNTVLNNQYEVTRKRYKFALREARYLAYMARLAIEQRIGARLDETSFPGGVGPMEPPAKWADDICSLEGIDYTKYREAPEPEWASEPANTGGSGGSGGDTPTFEIHPALLDGKFVKNLLAHLERNNPTSVKARQYVGDYVQRLEDFVTYYNIDFPFRDGTDTSVLSLREDLLNQSAICVVPSPNRIRYSGKLYEGTGEVLGGEQSNASGWGSNACRDQKCLSAYPASILGESVEALDSAPQGLVVGDATWLVERPATFPADPNAPPATSTNVFPDGSVFQTLDLQSGPHVVSWWDSARNGDGGLLQASQKPSSLLVSVFDETGATVAARILKPHVAAAGSGAMGASVSENYWSNRRSFGFNAPESGKYTIVVQVSASGESEGSVVIAGLQLEPVAAAESQAGTYYGNDASLLAFSSDCRGTEASRVGRNFTYKCEGDSCYYELNSPILLNTGNLTPSPTFLNGKLAAGNYNFRHESVALNFIGTGLIDCSKNPSTGCYSNGTVEYTLVHEAPLVPIKGWDKEERCFNFGSATIHDGKALAAEKVITTPIGGADNGLLSQAGITKREFRGRPLNGAYRLKVWDRPGLQWENLKDIQVVLNYRYWSPVDANKPEGQ